MSDLYKLTHPDGMTRNGTKWGFGVTHTAKDGPPNLCSGTVIHAYDDPLVAVFMDSVHGNFGPRALMWEAEGRVVVDDGSKVGCKSLTTWRTIDPPSPTAVQRVAFGVLVTMDVSRDKEWVKWAEGWLSGADRSYKSANRAATCATLNSEWAAARAASGELTNLYTAARAVDYAMAGTNLGREYARTGQSLSRFAHQAMEVE